MTTATPNVPTNVSNRAAKVSKFHDEASVKPFSVAGEGPKRGPGRPPGSKSKTVIAKVPTDPQEEVKYG